MADEVALPPPDDNTSKDSGISHLTDEIQKLRNIVLTAGDSVEKIATAEGKIAAIRNSATDGQLKQAKQELADLDANLKAKTSLLSKAGKEDLEVEKMIAAQRGAAQRDWTRAIGDLGQQAIITKNLVEVEKQLRDARATEATKATEAFNKINSGSARVTAGLDAFSKGLGAISSALSIITNTTVYKQSQELPPALARARAALHGAGEGEGVLQGVLGGKAGGLALPAELATMVKSLAETGPLALKSASGLEKMVGVLGSFGKNLTQSFDELADSSYKLGWGTKDLTENELRAQEIHKQLGMSTVQASTHLKNLMLAAKEGSGGLSLVATALHGFTGYVKDLNFQMTSAQREKFTQNLVGGLASMSIPTIAGFFMAAKGRGYKNEKEEAEAEANPAPLMQSFWNAQTAGMDKFSKILFAGTLAQQMNMNLGKPEQHALYEKLNAGGLSKVAFDKISAKDIDKAAAEGWKVQHDMLSSSQKIEINTARLLSPLSTLVAHLINSPLVQSAAPAASIGWGGMNAATGLVGLGLQGYSAVQMTRAATLVKDMATAAAGEASGAMTMIIIPNGGVPTFGGRGPGA